MADPLNLLPIMCQYRIAVGIKSIAIKLAFYKHSFTKKKYNSDLITTNNLDFMFLNVFMWLSGRSIASAAQRVVGSIPREHTYW